MNCTVICIHSTFNILIRIFWIQEKALTPWCALEWCITKWNLIIFIKYTLYYTHYSVPLCNWFLERQLTKRIISNEVQSQLWLPLKPEGTWPGLVREKKADSGWPIAKADVVWLIGALILLNYANTLGRSNPFIKINLRTNVNEFAEHTNDSHGALVRLEIAMKMPKRHDTTRHDTTDSRCRWLRLRGISIAFTWSRGDESLCRLCLKILLRSWGVCHEFSVHLLDTFVWDDKTMRSYFKQMLKF